MYLICVTSIQIVTSRPTIGQYQVLAFMYDTVWVGYRNTEFYSAFCHLHSDVNSMVKFLLPLGAIQPVKIYKQP